MATSQRQPEHLFGVIDMGSNGIRFSITSLAPPTARIMPTLYQSRAAVSLFDAQFPSTGNGERQAIPEDVIAKVVSSFLSFKRTCADFSVPADNVYVLATEATRTAPNSEEFLGTIKQKLGWSVKLLEKEEEGRVGAMGIASSLPNASGLVMDLGGGSTQLSWLINRNDSRERIRMPSNGAASLPYGAAALIKRLDQANAAGSNALQDLKDEITTRVQAAYKGLQVPEELEELAKDQGGFPLYLSGGGFRGWGYFLMSHHRIQPYPIPVINGFTATRDEFLNTAVIEKMAVAARENKETDAVWGISDRRASQVPAVALLVTTISEALPQISHVRFCQGGVREGWLFQSLKPEIQSQHPLVVATQPFDTPASSLTFVDLLQASLPPVHDEKAREGYSDIFTTEVLDAFANVMFHHSSHSKDLQAAAALRSTTAGILAGVHGILHESRAILGLLLCARWGGSLSPIDIPFKQGLESYIDSPWKLWWINYIGAIAALIASVYPAGVVDLSQQRVRFAATWDQTAKGHDKVVLQVAIASELGDTALENEFAGIERVGKRKRWIGGREGSGFKVEVKTTTTSS